MRGILIAVAAGLVLGLALLWVAQRKLIYLPYGGVSPPASFGLRHAEDVTFTTDDGLTLHAWFVPAVSTPPRFTMIVFNGNAGHRGMRAPMAAEFADRGVATLLFDYRGFGDNSGTPTEDGLARDARAALGYVASRPGVDPRRIVFLGESLGAAVALRLATERPPLALVLRSPFSSLADIGRHHYPYLPVRLLLRDRYPSLDRARTVSSPTLVIAGDSDSIIPLEHSKRLYEALRADKRLVVIAGADHNDESLFVGRELIDSVLGFVAMLDER
jgi:fermentation-respiration switch protein FrsA (DUF1100 family)